MKFRNFLIIYIVLILIQVFSMDHSYYGLIQDGRFKYLQVLDLIHYNFTSFERYYPDRVIDINYTHRIYLIPFEHYISPKVFSVFPWLWALINAPFYLLFPYPGLLFLSILFGGLSYYYFFLLLKIFNFSKFIVTSSMIFFLVCTPLVIYSSWYYEATCSSFLLYYSIFITITELSGKKRLLIFFLSGVITGLHLFLRIEVGLLNGLINSIIFLYYFIYQSKNKINIFKPLLSLLFGLFFMVILFLISNKIIYGIYEPLIVYDVIENSTTARLNNLIGYLFTYHFSILIYSPFLFITLFYFFKKGEDLRNNQTSLLRYLLIIYWVFIIIIPLVAPPNQGVDATPRYLFPVIPLTAIFIFVYFEGNKFSNMISILIIIYSSIYIISFSNKAIKVSKKNAVLSKKIEPYISDYNIINAELLNNYLYNFSRKSFYLCLTPQEIIEFNERIKKITLKSPRIILLKSKDPDEMPNADILKKTYRDEYQSLVIEHKKYLDLMKILKSKVYFEDETLVIFESN